MGLVMKSHTAGRVQMLCLSTHDAEDKENVCLKEAMQMERYLLTCLRTCGRQDTFWFDRSHQVK